MVEIIYNKYHGKLIRHAEILCQDSELAKDLVQNSYKKFIEKDIKESIDKKIYSAIKISITNEYIDILRREEVKKIYIRQFAINHILIEDKINNKIDFDLLFEKFKKVVKKTSLERYFYLLLFGYNSHEIAEVMNISKSAARQGINRMKNKLREELIKT